MPDSYKPQYPKSAAGGAVGILALQGGEEVKNFTSEDIPEWLDQNQNHLLVDAKLLMKELKRKQIIKYLQDK